MHVRTFRAASLQEALEQVRSTLGPDAAVLHTRELKQGRLGFFSKRLVEVDASVDVAVASRFQTNSRPRSAAVSTRTAVAMPTSGLQAGTPVPATLPETAPPPGSISNPAIPTGPSPVAVSPAPASPPAERHSMTPAAFEVLTEMLDNGIDALLARDLLKQATSDDAAAADPWLIKGRISQRVAAMLPTGGALEMGDGRQRIVALVGTTGTGKTTTVAKIAAGMRFDMGCEVGLITLDTFRMGAVDQLLQYAELVSAQLEVVSSAHQVTAAMQRLRECDVILIDTAGRAPRDADQLRVLQEMLRAGQPDAVHLVLSASGSAAHARETLERFAPLNPTHTIITKLDEAAQFGSWLSVLQDCPWPISYLSAGQDVPQDLSVASARRLASLLVGHQ